MVSLVPLALLVYVVWSWSLPPAPPTVVAATDASRVVWSAVIEPLLPYILLVVLLMGDRLRSLRPGIELRAP